MKRCLLIMSLFCVAYSHASDSTVTVKDNGTYTVGARKHKNEMPTLPKTNTSNFKRF